MGMKSPIVGKCPTRACADNVLCCSYCGFCGGCHLHNTCDTDAGGMKSPQKSKCPECGTANVLCCSSCGYCGECRLHYSCNVPS